MTFDVPIDFVREITLPYIDNNIAFEFAALDFTEPARNQYAYILEGLDDSWIYCSTRRYVSYAHLEPGEYTFKVRAANNDGLWSSETAAVKLVIVPPLWMTDHFRLLAVVIALASVLVFHSWRTSSVRTKKRSGNRPDSSGLRG